LPRPSQIRTTKLDTHKHKTQHAHMWHDTPITSSNSFKAPLPIHSKCLLESYHVCPHTWMTLPGLPDSSWCNMPKWRKCIPNDQKFSTLQIVN
jgi:hypothetical protein